MKLSIITVTYNNCEELKETYQSICDFADFDDVVWIVIDGGSSDGSVDFLSSLEERHNGFHFLFISENDDGLYDAMNKGIDLAEEDSFIWFLNAGDLASDYLYHVFRQVDSEGTDIFIGASERFGDDKYYVKMPKRLTHLSRGMICEHQAFIIKANIAKQVKYDIHYKLAADYDFIIRCIRDVPTNKILFSKKVFCKFRFGGLSKIKRTEAILEDSLIRYRSLKMGFFKIMWIACLQYVWDKYKNLIRSIR